MAEDPQTFAIIGAAMKVYNTLGFGFLEPVYQAALAREFEYQNIPFAKEVSIPVYYREEKLDTS